MRQVQLRLKVVEHEGRTMSKLENCRASINKTIRTRWFGAIIACVSIGATVLYLLRDKPRVTLRDENVVDDRGTSQREASQLLMNLRDRAFDADNEKIALALGRPEEEVRAWYAGLEVIDDDVVMKARGIALHRGVNIE